MKYGVWTGLLLFALASAASAQQPKKSVINPPPPAATAELAWVTCRSSSTVVIYPEGSFTTAQATVTLAGLEPYGILALQSARRIYVASTDITTRAAFFTVIDADTRTVIRTFALNNVDEARRMCFSRDGNHIFLAAQSGGLGAAVQLNLTNPDFPSMAGVFPATATGIAEDITEIPASAAGGSGTGPGKLYYSVPAAGAVAVHNFINNTTGLLTLTPNTNLPRGLDRSPDDSFVLIACNQSGGPTQHKVLQVVSSTDVVTEYLLGLYTFATPTWDVVFRPGATSPFTVYLLTNQVPSWQVETFLANGATFTPTGQVTGALNPPNLRTLALNVSSFEDRVYVGSDDPVSTNFIFSPTPVTAAGNWNRAAGGTAGNTGPTDFAFMPVTPPVVLTACPKGIPLIPGQDFLVEGAFFQSDTKVIIPTISAGAINCAVNTIDSHTIHCQIPGPPVIVVVGDGNLTVSNWNGGTAVLQSFFTVCDTANPSNPTTYTLTLPSQAQGYQMLSAPSYYTKSMLRKALVTAFGAYNPSRYRVFFWEGNRYSELPEKVDELCDWAGGGFWVLTRNGGTITFDALDCNVNQTAGIRVIPLSPGWNMVSTPFKVGALANMPWGAVQVTADGQGWTGAVAADTSPDLSPPFEFVNGAYVPLNPLTLIGGRAYFVENVDPSKRPLYLLFDPGAATKPTPIMATKAWSSSPPPPPSGMEGDSSCGMIGIEWLVLGAARFAFHGLRRRRRLAA